MQVNLYNNLSDKKVVNKNIQLTEGYPNAKAKTERSIIDPIITITSSTPPTSNYAYIERYGRYYYITNIRYISGDIWELDMHCDVLMSFKNAIKNCSGIVERQENDYNLNIRDNNLPVMNDTFAVTKKIGTASFSVYNNIILVNKGIANIE